MNHADWSHGLLEEWVEAFQPTHPSTPTIQQSNTPLSYSP
jgi:hypothetical protein